ncbi:hypothetical protein TNCV_2826551 [Trichonephila clavipes]|nr:hypothetical protein TNCV_2826551 [Trichonephila clavipes]
MEEFGDGTRCKALRGNDSDYSTPGTRGKRGKKELIEWCMKGLIASSYECPKCNEQMGLNERTSVVWDGFEWRCRKKAIGVSNRPKLTGIVRGKAFLHVLRRRPIGCPDSRKRTL